MEWIISNIGEVIAVLIGSFMLSGFSFLAAFILIKHFNDRKKHD